MDDSPTLFAAFGAGALSIASPAVVPLLPGFLACTWNRALPQLAACLLGFSVLFVGLGAGATSIGQLLLEHLTLLERTAGVVLITFGLRDLGVPGMTRRTSAGTPEPATALTLVAAVAAGAALTFAWTPLPGAVLNQVLAMATSGTTVARGVALLAAYAAGRALLMCGVAIAIRAVRPRATAAESKRSSVQLIAGSIVTLTGMLLFVGVFPQVAAALVRFLPLA